MNKPTRCSACPSASGCIGKCLNWIIKNDWVLDARGETRLERVMRVYRCSQESANSYLDLREEGYGQYQSAVMAGISDPQE